MASNVVAVSMDMNAQHDSGFRRQCPHPNPTTTPFHLIELWLLLETLLSHGSQISILDQIPPCYLPSR